MRGLLISGTASGVGKTTVALAIIAGMQRRGLAVQPFKCGPDFLDTGHHTRIAGRTARNLDTWMLSADANRNALRSAARGADVLVAEGMMGLFDGKSGSDEVGSSAEIAKLLQLPVVLVLDASTSARSIAAVVLGFESYDPGLPLAGVILNRVAGECHYEMLREAIASSCNTKVLGWLPHDPTIAIPERHLGLRSAIENNEIEQDAATDKLAALAQKYLELDALLELRCGMVMDHVASRTTPLPAAQVSLRVGVACDEAFSFYYEDNLDLLREQGAEIIRFSPLHDRALPRNLDALYLGGGYPEIHAARLSDNSGMLRDIQAFADSGKPIYAECGGMMYLAQTLTTVDGTSFPMSRVLPFSVQMTKELQRFGYVTVTFLEDCLLGPRGSTVRGHSFHCSRILAQERIENAYLADYSLSGQSVAEGFRHNNVLASYIHLHFRANPSLARNFVTSIMIARALSAVTA